MKFIHRFSVFLRPYTVMERNDRSFIHTYIHTYKRVKHISQKKWPTIAQIYLSIYYKIYSNIVYTYIYTIFIFYCIYFFSEFIHKLPITFLFVLLLLYFFHKFLAFIDFVFEIIFMIIEIPFM